MAKCQSGGGGGGVAAAAAQEIVIRIVSCLESMIVVYEAGRC